MSTYSGFMDGVAFANHERDFTRKLDASVLRMRAEEALSVGDLGGQLEGGEKEDEESRCG